MYKLLKPFPNGLTVMVEEVQNHIARIGLEAVNGLKGENVIQFNLVYEFTSIKLIYNDINIKINLSRYLLYLLNKCCKYIANIRN